MKIYPRHAFVLLEHVDSTGTKREDWLSIFKTEDGAMDTTSDYRIDAGENGVTLPSLLNAVDGIASNEGRILIMTTNNPESLGSALKSPGRVDLQICFGSATMENMELCFLRT